MYDDVITLIAIDERGNDVGKHEVFCRRESITRAEHYQAAAVGLHPSVQFRLTGATTTGSDLSSTRGSATSSSVPTRRGTAGLRLW